jgi:transcriptional regulator with XRE-family HTH domain
MGQDAPLVIGERVKRLRKERELTQRQLAEPSYTAAYISTLEAGKVRPSEAALRHLAERLDVSYEELATGAPQPSRHRAPASPGRRAADPGHR